MGHDKSVSGSRRLIINSDALVEWCVRWLGATPKAELFDAGFLSTVKGLRLTDGRKVVVKVRPDSARLAGCAAVHRTFWLAGFPCPELLVELQPLGSWVASAESFVPGSDHEPTGDLIADSAAALAHLLRLAPDPASVPSLAPSPSWTAWDHVGPDLWPTSEDVDVDLNDVDEPLWLARVAAAIRDRLRSYDGRPVIGHGDWHAGNLRWRGSTLVAVHDWDSVICQPEAAVVGFAAVSFRGVENPTAMATVDDSADFLAAYQAASHRSWTTEEESMSWAAGLWQRVVDAKVHSLHHDAEQSLTRAEAAARLSRARLDPRLTN